MNYKLFVGAFAFVFVMFFSTKESNAQRFCFVDSEKILTSLSEYTASQKAIDDLAAKWKSEIATEYEEIKTLYKAFQAEKVLLTKEEKVKRENEIIKREQKVRQIQKDKFGPKGELFSKREELIQPIQDKIMNALNKYADEKNYDFILDQAAGASILYSNPKYDKTQDVLLRIQ